jgi:hypothetical protein
VNFPTAGPRFHIARPHQSLSDVLVQMVEPHAPDLARALPAILEDEFSEMDAMDRIELLAEIEDIVCK